MKTVLIAAAAVGLSAASVSAADIAARTYTKAPLAPATSWTGFYLSGGGGYGIANQNIAPFGFFGSPVSAVDSGLRGYFGTVSAGYDYQFAPRWVGGIFASYDISDINGTESLGYAFDTFAPIGGKDKLNSTLAVGARLGWLADPKTLLFLSGGYSQAHFDSFGVVPLGPVGGPPLLAGIGSRTVNGWFIGAGTESKLDFVPFLPGDNWFVRAEYRYAEYDKSTSATNLGVAGVQLFTFASAVQSVRTELVYKFNTGGGATYASPASLPVKAAVAAPKWTGFYVSGGGGYGFASVKETPTIFFAGGPVTGYDSGARGGFGTVSAGFDYQFTPKIVAGVLANYDFSDINGKFDAYAYSNPVVGVIGTQKLKDTWAAGGRLGWLATPSTLTYFSAGYTEAKFDQSPVAVFGVIPVGAIGGHTHQGYFLGSGLESKLDFLPGNNWFLKTEYRYADYSGKSVNVGGGSYEFKPVVQTVRVELSYKFNWLGPVVAKY